MKKLRIGVIYGGRSSEHEISLASAASVLMNLDRTRYEPVPVRIERDGRWTLADRAPAAISAADVIEAARTQLARPARPGRETYLAPRPGEDTLLTVDRPGAGDGAAADAAGLEQARVAGLGLDVVFPVLHGPYGEDGTVQGLLELADVPYVGAGVLASAVGMDKAMMKLVFAASGLPIVDYLVVSRRDWLADRGRVAAAVTARLPLPVFVKPANLGSSVGISKVKEAGQLGAALDLAATFDRRIVVEAAVPRAREIECAVLGNDEPEASVPGEVVPSREFYDYEAKYLDEGSTLRIPAPLTEAQAAEVRRLAVAAFRAIDGAGLARVDFLMDGGAGTLYVNEVNTIPGFTTISMYPKLWEATGLAYPALLDRLIALALERHADKAQRRTTA
ncbi:MAG TPA: D-alanine--D-alanine ligase family protein [Vicinamibacterales bacterium]|nr:D-alanine--D-alanine ligase family protein [Vicinamibacterales bacterium]